MHPDPLNPQPLVSTDVRIASNAITNFVAKASDADDIVKVEFFADGMSMGEASREQQSLNWSLDYTFLNLPEIIAAPKPKEISIIAVATDNDGNVSTSTNYIITLSPPSGGRPSVDMRTPMGTSSSPAEFAVETSVPLIAYAEGADSTIDKVRFYANGELIILSDLDGPSDDAQQQPAVPTTQNSHPADAIRVAGTNFYRLSWRPKLAGPYNIVAVAFDDSTSTNVNLAPISNVSALRSLT